MIVFDLQAVQSVAHGERGIARFVGELARALSADHPDVVDAFVWNDGAPRSDRLDRLGLGDRLLSYSDLRGHDVDVLHINSPFETPHIPNLMPPVRARRLVTTCYDLIPVRFPDLYLAEPGFRARYRTRLGLLAAADAILTDSQSAADDVHELLGVARDRLTVIGAGVSSDFAPPERPLGERLDALRSEIPSIEARYVLVPTGVDPRKNTDTVVAAYAALPPELRDRHQLVLACKLSDDQRADLEQLCVDDGVDGRVITTGYVSDDVLVLLYQNAELVVFPSIYEGFGLPVLEARRCGAPVICSNSSSLPEVLDDVAARFNPGVPAEITALMERALTDPAYAARLDAIADRGFTWSRAAARAAEAYQRLAASARPAPTASPAAPISTPASRRRLALVTPLPPAKSGIADHSANLIEALVDQVGVDVVAFAPHPLPGLHHPIAGPVHHVAALPHMWTAREVDQVLYCFGNHPLHRSFLGMLRHVPGHVLLHDVRLRGAVSGGEPPDPDDPEALFIRAVVERATSVLVQSNHAAELVRDATGVAADNVGPLPSPIAVTHGSIAGVDGDGDVDADVGPPWVVSLGVAHESKGSDVIAAAMESLVADGVVRAAMVGPDAPRFLSDPSGVVVADHVSDAEFAGWLRRAAVAVQLRPTSNGESSGVAAAALAHGTPVIVSDAGAMRELPDDAVVKAPTDITGDVLAALIADTLADADALRDRAKRGAEYAAAHTIVDQARLVAAAVFGA